MIVLRLQPFDSTDLNTDEAWESGELGADQAHVGKLSSSELASDIATIKLVLKSKETL